jgi:hypothetical protein
MVDDLDRELQVLAVVLDRPLRVEHPRGRELRLVHLQDQPGVGDRLVLLAHHLRDGHHVLLLGVVEAVAGAGAEAERAERGDEALHALAALDRLEHGLDVLGDRLLTGVADRGGRDPLGGRLRRRARGHEARPDRATRAGQPQARLVEAREVLAVAGGDALPLRRPGPVDREVLPAGHPVVDVADVVGAVRGLHVLAVVEDRDAALDLLVDDLGDRAGDPGVDLGPLALALGDQLVEVGRPREVAAVGGQDAVLAALHRHAGSTSPLRSWVCGRISGSGGRRAPRRRDRS